MPAGRSGAFNQLGRLARSRRTCLKQPRQLPILLRSNFPSIKSPDFFQHLAPSRHRDFGIRFTT
jgi:hypothetical protein